MKTIYLITKGDQTTRFPFPLELEGYECALVEMNGKITYPNDNTRTPYKNVYLCCDIIEESLVGNVKMPILRYIPKKNNLVNVQMYNMIWLKVMRPTISSIRLYS